MSPGLFRPELQGLRAVAILMVVCYHIWFGRVSGGVDIFLLISAFLLTGSFTRKLETDRPLAVLAYWIHAFKRLLPPAAVVILSTLAGIALLLPPTRFRDLLDEAIASALYYENWLLAARSVDYYAADHSTASPFQHFWSLSIQGQVFLLWPLLFALAALIAHHTRIRPRLILLILFGAVTAASFAWSVHFTATDQAFAYFDTRTRIWEFGLGSLFALLLPTIEQRIGYRRSPDPTTENARTLRALASWTGLALVLSAGWVIDVEGAFPGYAALWPLLAAGLVIMAGPTHTRWGADRLLSSRPLQWLGDISYALYLVHWPLLILTLVTTDTSYATPLTGTALITASILTAWALTRFVDTPIRTSPRLKTTWWRGTLVITTSLALVLTATTAWRLGMDHREATLEAAAWANNPGARSLDPDYTTHPDNDPHAPPLPLVQDLPSDMYRPETPCRDDLEVPTANDFAAFCREIHDPGEPDAPLVVVAGNSHAMQFNPMIRAAADDLDWRIISVSRPQCSFGDTYSVPWCLDYNRTVVEFLLGNDVDGLITPGTLSAVPEGGTEVVVEGFEPPVQHILDAGIPVLAIRDNPRFDLNMAECASIGDLCETPIHRSLAQSDPLTPVIASLNNASSGARISAVDMTSAICPDGFCRSVVGNVHVFIDSNHLSKLYSESMGPAFYDAVVETDFSPEST